MKIIRTKATIIAGALLMAPALCPAQVTFYSVGDLPGGIIQSDVRDTTRVGTVLYAVGGTSATPVPGTVGNDTAFLWTSTGGMVEIPPLVPGLTEANPIIGSAITPDAAYIASRARFNPGAPGQRHAVRVKTSDLTEIDLGTLAGFPQQSVATAISTDGSILYGFARYTGTGQNQAVRYTVAGPTVTAIPFLNAGDDTSSPAPRASSADGSVMVGTSTNSLIDGGKFYGLGNGAFRYVQGTGVAAIPYRPGGTWNMAVALSPNGNLAMVVGDSTAAPNGEIYLYDATSLTQTSLGTPTAGWETGNLAGMTPDGSLAVIAFFDPGTGAGASFLHNGGGWHEIQAIVAGAGVNLTGWTLDSVEGISSDGMRIWGSGVHNGNREGFIVEFPAGYLAAYAASPPAQSIVGSYSNTDNTTEGANVIIFMANGTYYQIQDAPAADAPSGVDGFERGTYTWDPVTHAFTLTTLLDTNGDEGPCPGICGVAGLSITMLGNYATLSGPGGAFSTVLVTGSSPIVGSWVAGDTTVPDSSAVLSFFANGTYLMAQDGPSGDPTGHDGMERGTYTWNPGTGAFTATTLVDTNGEWGLSNPQGPQTVTVSGNTLTIDDGTGPVALTRVVAPPQAPTVAVTMAERTHLAAGLFDLVLGVNPLNPTTEPRIGPNHNIVFTFHQPVTGGNVTVDEGVATAGTPIFSGNLMTVPLTGVSNQQYVTVSVSGVTSADGGTGGTGSVRVGYLVGDVNQSRVVSVGDLGLVNSQLAQPVTAANFLKDVNASGTLTLADKGITNANLTKALPPP
jgi:hypothetical protein